MWKKTDKNICLLHAITDSRIQKKLVNIELESSCMFNTSLLEKLVDLTGEVLWEWNDLIGEILSEWNDLIGEMVHFVQVLILIIVTLSYTATHALLLCIVFVS